jgi:hypothetical protein
MKTSIRRKMYSSLIIENHQRELECVFEELFDVVSYILAGAIVIAEDEYNFYADDSVAPNVVSDAVKHLTNQIHYSPTCRQMPLVLRAIRIYRKNTVPALRGYQTLCTDSASKKIPIESKSVSEYRFSPLASLLAAISRYSFYALLLLALAMIAIKECIL